MEYLYSIIYLYTAYNALSICGVAVVSIVVVSIIIIFFLSITSFDANDKLLAGDDWTRKTVFSSKSFDLH